MPDPNFELKQAHVATRAFLFSICVVLAGYAFMGRGFAHIGIPPLFVGEIALLGALAHLSFRGSLRALSSISLIRILIVFIVWSAFATLPHIPDYGLSALRDAVTWGYSVFAFSMASVIITRPKSLRWILTKYRSLVHGFLLMSGILFLINQSGIMSGVRLPGMGADLLDLKGGDLMVHLAGAASILAVGMIKRRGLFTLLLIADLGLIVTSNRGGMVAFMGAMALLLFMRPPKLKVLAPAALISFFAVTLLLFPVRIDMGGGRDISTEQLSENVKSLFGASSQKSLENTEDWRMNWWGDIVDYTFGGRYFVFGKGYGINLASADGYQVTKEEDLRSPHNGHMTILARSGVPGFMLWLFLNGAWFVLLIRAGKQAARRGDMRWHAIFTVLVCYALAFHINASFDVYLEGPMGGIWFWTVFGVGIGALHVYRKAPNLLFSDPKWVHNPGRST